MNEQEALVEQKNHFNSIAEQYVHELGGKTIHEYYQKMGSDYTLAALRAHSGDVQKLVGVELGCGVGETTAYFHELTQKTIGVDFSSEMIHTARQRFPRGFFSEAWFHQLPFENASVDFIFSFGTFHHLLTAEHYKRVLAEAFRVLRPGGVILISDINPWNPLTTIISRAQKIDLGNERFFSRREVLPLYRDAGFRPARVVDYGYIPHFLRPLSWVDGIFSRLKIFVFGRYQLIIGSKPRQTT